MRVRLIGAPNSGKTTLFNHLTASNFKTVNYPGATVEVSQGETDSNFGEPIAVFDCPGTYSLFPKSYDEKVAVDSLYAHPTAGAADLVVAVADVTQLSRHLYLVFQLKEAGFPIVLALTNSDLMEESGRKLDVQALESKLEIPCVLINGQNGRGVAELVRRMRTYLPINPPHLKRLEVWNKEKSEQSFENIKQLVSVVVSGASLKARDIERERTTKIDSVLMHPLFGLIIFILFMSLLFTGIFWLASPVMGWIDQIFSWISSRALSFLGENLAGDFVSNAVISGMGAVLIFLPQIFILFLGICYFEDSGYLARAAALVDRPLSWIGLNGRSFVPLLSGYACAIPAMMAARTISSRKERFLTLFVVPLMSCSARLPVYALFLAFLFQGKAAWLAGLSLAFIYFLSLVLGSGVAAIVGKLVWKAEKSFFMLELPIYRKPKLKVVLRQTLERARTYVMKAGPIIFVLSMIIWGACTFPEYQLKDNSERLNHSYAAKIGHLLEPVMEPMGADWRVGIGLVSAFAAREVFVSSMAVVFHIADQDEESMQGSLLQKMSEAKNDAGEKLFTISSVMGLIVFFMIALQCVATVGLARREFGSWRIAIAQLFLFNLFAYILAVSLVQGLRFFGVA